MDHKTLYNKEEQIYHNYLRKWSFEYLISPISSYLWKPNEMTKCLYAVSEKYCRDKRFDQVHIDSANILLLQYITEIFESNFDISVFYQNVEHVYFIENVRISAPYDIKIENGKKIRILPDQCKKLNMTYGFNLIFDIVYRTFTHLDYPIFEEDTKQIVKDKIEKEWHKKKDLERKLVGKRKWYQDFPSSQVKLMETYKEYMIFPIALITGTIGCHLRSPLLQPGECRFVQKGIFCANGTYRIAPSLSRVNSKSRFWKQRYQRYIIRFLV